MCDNLLTYFSHSYRPEDYEINSFFWNLFSEKGFYFEVDPPSDFLSIPYLEKIMQRSSCFVAIVTFRKDQDYSRCSPYILYEYGLATLAKKPKLVFYECGVDPRFFSDGRFDKIPFNRDLLKSNKKDYIYYLEKLYERSYGNKHLLSQQTNTIGIIIDPEKGSNKIYTEKLINKIASFVDKKGFELKKIEAPKKHVYQFCHDIDECEFIIIDESKALTSEWISSFTFGRFIPSIRIYHVPNNNSKIKEHKNVHNLISKYYFQSDIKNDIEPIIYWNNSQTLITAILKHIDKIEKRRVSLKEKQDGIKYFKSLSRKNIKIFISNPDTLNNLANKLSQKLNANYINNFQYKKRDAINVGDNWSDKIKNEIDTSGIFIPLINKDYFNKDWCRKELEQALSKRENKEIIIMPYYFQAPINTIIEHIQSKQFENSSSPHIVDLIMKDIFQNLKI